MTSTTMKSRLFAALLAVPVMAGAVAAGPAAAQGYKPNPFGNQNPDQSVAPPNQTYQGNQGFSFQGDQLPPSYDRNGVRRNATDPRYSQTAQQQQQDVQTKPGGGCLRYGAVGAAGGHLAGHGVLGALAGCATGAYIRHRDKASIREQQQN